MNDESDLRILDVCKETNVSTSVIYGHFGSRQGLIDASLLHLFGRVTDEVVIMLGRAAAGPHPTGSFVDTLYGLVSDPANEQSIVQCRQMYFRVSSTALSRRSLRAGYLKLYRDYWARLDDLYADLIERGLLGEHLSARQWGLFFESQMVSRAIHDLNSPWDELDDWGRIAAHVAVTEPLGYAD